MTLVAERRARRRAAEVVPGDVLVKACAPYRNERLFSLQGLRNLGPTLRDWRRAWQELGVPKVPASIDAPRGAMQPIGYVVLQYVVRLDRPEKAYDRWLVPLHRSTTAHLRSTYPFQSAEGLGGRGVVLGTDLLAGGSAFCFDPFEAYTRSSWHRHVRCPGRRDGRPGGEVLPPSQ